MIKISTITAPSLPSYPFNVSKGVTGSNGTLIIFGQSLPNYLSNVFNDIVGDSPYSTYDSTTLFNLSNIGGLNDGNSYNPAHYGIDNEVIFGWLTNSWDIYHNQLEASQHGSSYYGNTYVTYDWFRNRDNACIFSLSRTFNAPPSGHYAPIGWWIMGAWIGWVSRDTNRALGQWEEGEIQENGYYHLDITISGSNDISQTINFAVVGIPAWLRLKNPSYYSFDWNVCLSNIFDTTNYIKAGVCNQPFTNGQSSSPNGIVAFQNAFSSTNTTVAEGTITGQSQGTTYTLYGFAQATNGLYYTCGSDSITTLGSSRPALFYWDNNKVSGNNFDIKASEWNRMIQNIKDVHIYKLGSYNASNYPMSNVSSEGTFYADRFNECRYAIGSLNATGIYTKYPGDIVYASDINTLSTKLNEIT